jgi:hypothetical protein
MDLLLRALALTVIIVVALAAVYYAFQSGVFSQKVVTEQQAEALVVNYLQSHNPNAIVNVTNVTPSQYHGSWHIVVSFISNQTTPCPTYLVYSYDYPKYGFVNRTENTYTDNCTVAGLVPGMNYAIGAYPIAITRSYSLGTPAVMAYVDRIGYGNVVVHADYHAAFSLDGRNLAKVWVVNYSSVYTNQSVYSVISQTNGSLVAVYNATR